MGRGRRPGTEETLEKKIEEAQKKVIKTKAAYDKAVDELQKLLDKRDARRKEDIWKAIIKSDRTYGYSVAAEPPFRRGEYRKTGIAYRRV